MVEAAEESYDRHGYSAPHRLEDPEPLGHKTRSIFERYNIKNEDDLREAAEAVAVMGKNGEKRAHIVPIGEHVDVSKRPK